MSKYRTSRVRFCPQGHDTIRFGRRYSGQCRMCDLNYRRTHKTTIRNIAKKCKLKQVYGLTLEQFQDLAIRQNNTCAICYRSQKDSNKLLVVDHDHKTGRIRGLLCTSCNLSLGLINDSKDVLKSALKYLEESHVVSAV